MLRILILIALLANAAYWAWGQGALAAFGFAPAVQTEPQRLAQQIAPQAVRLLKPDEARKAEATASAAPNTAAKAPECLLAGIFTDGEANTLRPALEAALPVGTWALESGVQSARWIVYMGKYPDAESARRKRIELRQLSVAFENLRNGSLEPGISLGGFATQAAANQELQKLAQRGVRTARVLQEIAELRGQNLRIADMNDALRSKLDAVKPQLLGKALVACPA